MNSCKVKVFFCLWLMTIMGISCKPLVEEKEPKASSESKINWIRLSETDSVEFIGFSGRVINNGKDTISFIHYRTSLFKTAEDARNPGFKKQSLLLLSRMQEGQFPDTLYLQAMGNSKGTIFKSTSNYNILCVRENDTWKANFEDKWYSLDDFENDKNP